MNNFITMKRSAWVALLVLCLTPRSFAEDSVTRKPFGKTPDGQAVDLYVLTNAAGMRATIMTYGAIVTSLTAADRDGKMDDVVLGFDSLDGYLAGHPYFGAIVGRYGNRIGNGTFSLDGKQYRLAKNDNDKNHLHGGLKGFDKAVWQARASLGKAGPVVRLTHTSPDGDEGYPGTLKVTVTYTLAEDNALRIEYRATTDKPTPVNLTNHSYFNLAGQGNGDILGHKMMIRADRFTPVDAGLIPTGELREVEGTPMDFRQPAVIGARIDQDDEQLRFGKGYDHNWVLTKQQGRKLSLAARVYEPTSGRVLEVLTTEPGIQFYTGNFLDGTLTGKRSVVYKHRYGFCLETQHFPDSPNKPQFPSTILRPGQQYTSRTVFRFSTRK